MWHFTPFDETSVSEYPTQQDRQDSNRNAEVLQVSS